MERFMVGDEVEVVQGGAGISPDNEGKRTIIIATGGNYQGTHDAVRTKDFENPGYEDWIGSRSFKLIKGVKRIVLKAGDRVAVIDCPNLRLWNRWERAIGRIYTLNSEQTHWLNEGGAGLLGKNEEGINYSMEMLEKL